MISVVRRLAQLASVPALALLLGACSAACGLSDALAASCTAGLGLRQITPDPRSLHTLCDRECHLVDRDGKTLDPVGSVVGGTHSEGLTVVSVGRLRGYVDDAGRWAVPARFEGADAFCDGIAPVLDPAGKAWGYIDHDGRFVIPPRFEAAGPMVDGVAPVRTGGRWGFVDGSGAFAIKPTFDEADVFSEGLAAVKQGDTWGFIDRSGAIAIAPRFDAAAPFRDVLALITARGSTPAKIFDGLDMAGYRGVIDRQGRAIVPADYEAIERLSAGIIAASSLIRFNPANQDEVMRIGLFRRDGSHLTTRTFEAVDAMAEGLIPACRRGRCGYLDAAGHLAIAMRFTQVRSFAEGLGGVVAGGRGMFIDRTGRVVIPRHRLVSKLDTGGAWRFANGLAPAACEGRWGYLDREGRWAIAPVFTSASEIDDGVGQVRQGTRRAEVIARTRHVVGQTDAVGSSAPGRAAESPWRPRAEHRGTGIRAKPSGTRVRLRSPQLAGPCLPTMSTVKLKK